jgi:hypothetical protein
VDEFLHHLVHGDFETASSFSVFSQQWSGGARKNAEGVDKSVFQEDGNGGEGIGKL